MKIKIICPRCATRLSRWHYFSTTSLHYRCRSCGARFRLTAAGWLATFGIIAIQGLWFVLARWQVIPAPVAIGLLLLTCGLAMWLLPYLTPVKLSAEEPTQAAPPPEGRH